MLEYVIIEARRQPENRMVLTKRIARNQRIGVGRTDSADLVLNDDPEISSIHFMVNVTEDACTITDQNSTNKTYYNGRPITQINIEDGEKILCGKTEFIFRLVFTVDDPHALKSFIDDKPWPAINIDPTPNPMADSTSQAERSNVVIEKPAPKPVQPPPSPKTQRPISNSSAKTPRPATSSSSNNSVPVRPTDSGDAINWNLFSEEESAAGKAGGSEKTGKDKLLRSDPDRQSPEQQSLVPSDDENETPDLGTTRVIFGQAPIANIIQVVIGIAGHSEPSARLVMDPRQNPEAVIGRAALSDLACPLDPTMSNRHFAIEIQDDQCLIRDLNSCNGTSVNGQRILIAPLRHGDRVRAGQTDFEIAIEAMR